MSKKILLVTGPAGEFQGWGNLKTTELIKEAIEYSGKEAKIVYVESAKQFLDGLKKNTFDIVWSALYHLSQKSGSVGVVSDEPWVADILDEKSLPYIGSSSDTMKNLIDKTKTNKILYDNNIAVPYQYFTRDGGLVNPINYPVFVKPSCESESNGIDEDSVVNSMENLEKRIEYIAKTFKQNPTVEEYLPGREMAVLMIGNNENRFFFPAVNVIDPSTFRKYPILHPDAKKQGKTRREIPDYGSESAIDLAKDAVNALNCLDHVRVDMRSDNNDTLKVIDVNGIPGLKPGKSASFKIYNLYHNSVDDKNSYPTLINTIVESALVRCGI